MLETNEEKQENEEEIKKRKSMMIQNKDIQTHSKLKPIMTKKVDAD